MKASHIFAYFSRKISHKSKHSNKRHKTSNYNQFIYVLLLTSLICFSIEPIVNIFTFLGDRRKPLTEDWIFYQYKAKKKYASQITGRKIVIVGGSSVLFGVSAAQIEAFTGIPTVNLGVHAGLGVDYILYKTKNTLKSGDIVLFSLEFPLYHGDKEEQLLLNTLRSYIISYDHDYINSLDFLSKLKVLMNSHGLSQEFFNFIKAFLKSPTFDKNSIYSRLSTEIIKNDCYSERALNKNGDQICNIGQSPLAGLKNEKGIDSNPNKIIDASNSIKEFIIFAKNNDIKIIPLYPNALYLSNYRSDGFNNYFMQIKNFWLSQNIPFEDSINNSFLEENMMFDTSWHPNDEGRTWRTNNIINILKKHL